MSMESQVLADENTRRAILNAISNYRPIRALDMDNLQVEVTRGNVTLRGLVASEASRLAAEVISRRIPGVKKVANDLITDDLLRRRIAVALASNDATSRLRIVVNVEGGIAGLFGAVQNPRQADAARQVALSIAGVAGVENRLHLLEPGSPAILAWQDSIEGRPLSGPSASPTPGENPNEAVPSPRTPPAATPPTRASSPEAAQ